ncbi:MAG: F0F1 ATP synthase subunit A, partial [Halothiobacillus sp. 20-54-6]
MSTETAGGSSVEYIQHHLANLSVGQGFWQLNIDTLIFSFLLGALILFV